MKRINPETPKLPLAIQFDEEEVFAIYNDLQEFDHYEGVGETTKRFLDILEVYIRVDK